MVLIARLAIDQGEQGRGLGKRLLADALRMAVIAGEAAAARLVVVDAIDEPAAQFYRRHGFTSELGESRLYLRMKDVKASGAFRNRDTLDTLEPHQRIDAEIVISGFKASDGGLLHLEPPS